MGSRRAQVTKEQPTRVTIVAKDGNRRSEEIDLKPHQGIQKPIESHEIRRVQDSTQLCDDINSKYYFLRKEPPIY
jgi:hypothetical protein